MAALVSARSRPWFRARGRAPPSAARGPLLAHLLITLAYVGTGKLALLLAVPPGYASPIFPPAGIAVAATLIGGPVTLPWIFLGSLLLNAWIGYSAGYHLDEVCFAAAVVIATASMLQAAVGGRAFRRIVGYPARLDNSRDLSLFLLLSPLFCLTSATLSLTGLWALGVVKLPDLMSSWISWWIGDTLGVLLALPLVLVIAGEPRALWRGRARPVALPMLLFFALFTAIFIRVSRWEHEEALLEFRLLSQQTIDKIRAGLKEQELFLEQLERSFSRPAALSRTDFRHLVQNLLERFPTIQAVKWAPQILSPQRAAFEAAQQSDLPGFEIREVDPSGHQRGAADRARYFPVTYVEPLKGNEHIVGFDLASEAGRRAAVEATLDTGIVTATPPIRLIQEQGEQLGILLVYAVHDGSSGVGVVSVALRMGTFMTGLLAPVNSMIRVRLVDLEPNKTLYSDLPPDGVFYSDTFAFGGRRYGVETAPTEFYLVQHRSWQSWAVLVIGVFSTGLLGALLLLGTGYTRRIETVVDERTHDLANVNRRLEIEIREREQVEAALRQAQRMEAIGQLTGGVAHDFNNLLTVIGGNAAMLNDTAQGDAMRRRVLAIMQAAERGERLTRQLLAFSRRQILRPEPVDLRHHVDEIADMLSPALRADIDVKVEMPEELWPVFVDLAEFQMALLNLGMNARDAMPGSGRFEIAARNVTFDIDDPTSGGLVGDFVAVTLSDTGAGMAPEVVAQAFEPYFTTKEIGLGSGLGLSQVYGFTQQSGGAVSIASAIGKGSSITLFLPRAAEGYPMDPSHMVAPEPLRASGRILVVEDDAEVAQVTMAVLQEIGYQAVEVRDGHAALTLIEQDLRIELVLSDVVMPGGMSGLELARKLRRLRPGLPVVLVTGYTQWGARVAAENFVFIAKPYRREALAEAIQTAFDRDSARGSITAAGTEKAVGT
jgi:signal transduction histidine kinase/ActR/RegA family two-component response regulator/sensor domain CHASE-containing protein